MTYEATVEFKFDATFTPTYGSSSWTSDDFIPHHRENVIDSANGVV